MEHITNNESESFNDKNATYLDFHNLKKAYDSVPIYIILTKLKCIEIHGKSYNFIENLYLSSKACIKKDNQYSDSFKVMKCVRQGYCEKLGVEIEDECCGGGLFADAILLKRVNKWAIENNMTFGINTCASMMVRPNTRSQQGKRDPTFYLGNKEIPKTNCYTYLGIPFNNTLSVISSIVLGIVTYYAFLLGSNKSRTNGTQQLVNKSLYWISGSKNKNSFVSLYTLSKELYISPLSAKCALAQNRCFEKRQKSKCIILTMVNNIPKQRKYFWCKESRSSNRKLSNFKFKEKIKEFYWNRNLLKKSIKVDNYIENKFEETIDYYKLKLEYPQYTKGFH
ncbi:hypothetical protein PIROE2DRAFT_17330 [Piromyces sp. E2]|nr:hypothetical protein PIROE2DRAFT_17330 [Piromyces sp. E2]|eukprot:OUM57620.1 hypothetical protein PIROE2DRAFT_17330 [Piromyces sp. E2]